MWKNEAQQIAAIRVLLRSLFSEKQVLTWWSDDGPTDAALLLLKQRGGCLSHGEAILFRAAFDFWNGNGEITLDEIITLLDTERVRMLCGLILALNDDTIDAWIDLHRRELPSMKDIPFTEMTDEQLSITIQMLKRSWMPHSPITEIVEDELRALLEEQEKRRK